MYYNHDPVFDDANLAEEIFAARRQKCGEENKSTFG